MSFNNVMPFWLYAMIWEHELAKMSCAFEEEWFSGTSKVCPPHIHQISRSNFLKEEYAD